MTVPTLQVPADGSAIFANVTVVSYAAGDAAYFTAYTGSTLPSSGGANVPANTTTAFGMPVDMTSGQFKLYVGAVAGQTTAPVDVIIDIEGYFSASAPSGSFTPGTSNVYDNRPGTLAGNATAQVQVAGVGGYLTAWADDQTTPTTSSLNYPAAASSTQTAVRTNLVTVPVGADGAISIANSRAGVPVNVVVVVLGWYIGGQAISNGQNRTQESVVLQPDKSQLRARITGVTYNARLGGFGGGVAFAAIDQKWLTPVSDGSHPTNGIPINSGGGFDPYVWDAAGQFGHTQSDELVQVQACYTVSSGSVCDNPQNLQLTTAFGASHSLKQIGPGSVSLPTGDYQVSATDVSVGSYLGDLSVGRTLVTLNNPDVDGYVPSKADRVFGPGWTASLPGPADAGSGDATIDDQITSGGYLGVRDPDGSEDIYAALSAAGTYPTQFVPVGDAVTGGGTVVQTDASTLSVNDADGTKTIFVRTGGTWIVKSVTKPGTGTQAVFVHATQTGGGSVQYLTEVVAATPNGISCLDASGNPLSTITQVVGCRGLLFSYGTVPGSSYFRLLSVALFAPTASSKPTGGVTVAHYDYDPNRGTLIDEYDPRLTPP